MPLRPLLPLRLNNNTHSIPYKEQGCFILNKNAVGMADLVAPTAKQRRRHF